jgi:hypothetical protein
LTAFSSKLKNYSPKKRLENLAWGDAGDAKLRPDLCHLDGRNKITAFIHLHDYTQVYG